MNTASSSGAAGKPTSGSGQVLTLVVAWAGVGLPLAWGVAETLRKALALFQ